MLLVAFTSCGWYPTNVICRVVPTFTFSENLPSMSVTIPLVVPFSTTLAPIIGSPFASTTTPVTVCICICSVTL